MKDNDAFNLLGERLAGRVLLILMLVAVFAMVGGFDYADQIAAEAKAKQERAARIAAYVDFHKDAIVLTHPLPYDVTVTQSGDGIAKPVTRHYFVKHEGKR